MEHQLQQQQQKYKTSSPMMIVPNIGFGNENNQYLINSPTNISLKGRKRTHSATFTPISEPDNQDELNNDNNSSIMLHTPVSPNLNNNDNDIQIHLPIDILEMIFSQLSYPDRCTCSWVCLDWKRVLIMKPYPMLENCLISLHHRPPLAPLLKVGHLLNRLEITFSPCSCNTCYTQRDSYQNLCEWVEYLKPACLDFPIPKVVIKVFHNPSPCIPPNSPSILYNNQINGNGLGSASSSPSKPMINFTTSLTSAISNYISPTTTGAMIASSSSSPSSIQQYLNHDNNNNNFNQQSNSAIDYRQQQQNYDNATYQSHYLPFGSHGEGYQYVIDRDPSNIFSPILHECIVNHESTREIMHQKAQFLDLEKPLALPSHDMSAVIPLSVLNSLLGSNIKNLKLRVCIDLPFSKMKQEDQFQIKENVSKLTEIGLLTHNPLDSSYSSACKQSALSLDKMFTTLFNSPHVFTNLKRLFLITTDINQPTLECFYRQLPNLEGLHISTWSHQLNNLFRDITTTFGGRLKELGIRFSTCSGIKYSNSFSHRDRKLEDSMLDLLTTNCPNLNYLSFEGWLECLTDSSLKYLNRLKLKHLVLKNGPDSRICRSMMARIKIDLDHYTTGYISEEGLRQFISNQPSLKVFEISSPEIEKFTSPSSYLMQQYCYQQQQQQLLHPVPISEDFITYILENCKLIKYVKLIDKHNNRSFARGNKTKYLRSPPPSTQEQNRNGNNSQPFKTMFNSHNHVECNNPHGIHHHFSKHSTRGCSNRTYTLSETERSELFSI